MIFKAMRLDENTKGVSVDGKEVKNLALRYSNIKKFSLVNYVQ